MSLSRIAGFRTDLPCISVVVACWNVEKYISKCIESILAQTYPKLEILLVDDCSTDSTASILRSYALKDSRIRVILRDRNGGLSECRNSGIENATGDLISFVDGDDALEPNTYQEIISRYDDSIDVYWFGANVIYESNNELKSSDDKYYKIRYSGIRKIKREELLDFDCSVWNKVFRKDFFGEKFKFKGRYYEDALFFMKFFALERKICFIPKKLYLYYRRPSSIMANTFLKKEGLAINHIFILDDIYDFWSKNGFLAESRIAFQRIVLSFFWFAYKHSQPFERARVVAEMVSRLRSWNIGCEANPVLEYIRSGMFTISFGPQLEVTGSIPTVTMPPLKGWQKIFSVRNENGHHIVRLFTKKIASRRLKNVRNGSKW